MIYVMGCNHGIQQQPPRDVQEKTEQRSCFAQLIEETIREGEIRFIGEEWDHNGGTTIAQDIASKHGVQHVNINTTRADLKQMEIPLHYTKLPYHAERKEQWHRQREQFMLRKIIESRGGAENLLVVCGFDHMLPLSDLLREETPEVKTMDYRKCDWYRPDVFSEDS
jgi:hypothetical protein